MKRIVLNIIVYLLNVFKIIFNVYIILIIIAALTPLLITNPAQYPILIKINHLAAYLTQPLIKLIKQTIPYTFEGTDYSQLILLIILLILGRIFFSIIENVKHRMSHQVRKEEYMNWRERARTTLSEEKLSELDNKFEELKSVKPSDRKKMLADFARLKNQLDNMGQQLAFLAIDVVDSTGMKKDEDKHIAAFDFDRYNEYVVTCLKENGVIKYASTPDGIMSCFRTVDAAVNAAVSLLEKLKYFNAHEKQIKQEFQIRCGINAGFVYIDDQTPLEQVTDRVIDIAGHMEKQAKPNGINIAATAIEPLKNRGGFSETPFVIDEQRVFSWSENNHRAKKDDNSTP